MLKSASDVTVCDPSCREPGRTHPRTRLTEFEGITHLGDIISFEDVSWSDRAMIIGRMVFGKIVRIVKGPFLPIHAKMS
jgi:hypothetical protein